MSGRVSLLSLRLQLVTGQQCIGQMASYSIAVEIYYRERPKNRSADDFGFGASSQLRTRSENYGEENCLNHFVPRLPEVTRDPCSQRTPLKKPTLSREEADEIIRWAAHDQVDAGLDVITDGEGRRENMYYFFEKRLDGLSFEEMVYRTYGDAGFGIEIASVVDKIENPRFELVRDWKTAREVTPLAR